MIPSDRQPGSMRCCAARLRSIRPAPSRRTSASPTSATSRPARPAPPPPSTAPRWPRARAIGTCDRRSDGPSPKSTVVRTTNPSANRNAGRSNAMPSRRGRFGGASHRSRSTPHAATARPARPPPTASTRFSVSRYETTPRRPDPSAVLTASSFWRAAPRTSTRLATFAHAMSSTIATAASSTISARRTSPTSRSRSVVTSTVTLVLAAGYAASRDAAIAVSSARAASTVAPSASRAMALE